MRRLSLGQPVEHVFFDHSPVFQPTHKKLAVGSLPLCSDIIQFTISPSISAIETASC